MAQNPAQVFPSFTAPQTAAQRQIGQPSPFYGKAWLFDFTKGDLAQDGQGRLVEGNGEQSWAQWCTKTILTERYMYLVYTRQHGVELFKAAKQHPRKAVESAISQTITSALLRDKRTRSVNNFVFKWNGDQVQVSLVCVPTTGTPNPIRVTLSGV